jgi:hypothetical protein
MADYLQAYLDLQKAVERADFFRYLVVLRYGGLYADTDVQCMSPIHTWSLVPRGSAMVVGIEAEFETPEEAFRRTYARQQQVRARTIQYPCGLDKGLGAALPKIERLLKRMTALSVRAKEVRVCLISGVHRTTLNAIHGTLAHATTGASRLKPRPKNFLVD